MGADLASWYDTITCVRDVQNHETLAYRHIWYENLLLAHNFQAVNALVRGRNARKTRYRRPHPDGVAVLLCEVGN